MSRLVSCNTGKSLPCAPCEVGYFYRATAIQYRLLTELGDARPFGGIVDVHIQGESMVQAVDEAVIHDIVHLVRGTFEGTFFADGSCKRMLIVLQEFFGGCAGCLSGGCTDCSSATHIFQIDRGYWVFLCKSSRAADSVRTAVRARMDGAVLQLDGLSLDGMDEGVFMSPNR